MVSYPLRGEARDNVGIVIKSAEQFEASYDKIMTERVKKLVLHQSPASLIGKVLSDHSELVILGNMDLSFEDKKKDGQFKVVIIESAEHSDGSWSAYIAPGWETYCLKSGDCDNGAPWWARGCDGSTVGEWAPGLATDVRAFVENLQGAIRSNDKGRVASLIHYPLRVTYFYGDRVLRIQSKTQFVANYDKIMTESLKTAILNESPPGVFIRDDGATLINGAIWFDVYNHENKIRSILVH